MTQAMGKRGAAALPLHGIRVLDFTHAAAGPFATMLLADLGAEVVKVERPGQGDGSRTMGEPMPNFPPRNSDYYLSLNRNKWDIALDLSSAEGAEIARDLARGADVVVQNFRPGVMDRLGLGFAALAAARPRLIYCSISAFGASGPLADRPANDIIMQSLSGLMGVTGEVGGGPVRIGAPISDFSTGLFALSGVLAALLARDNHPQGQHIEVAMLDASFNMMCNYIPAVLGRGFRVPRLGRGHAQIVPYQAFVCGDGEYAMVGAFTRNFWENLCRALGHEDWLTDPRFRSNSARLRNRDELIGELERIFAQKPRAQWLAMLEAADVPCSPVLELHDAVRIPQATANGLFMVTRGDGRAAEVVRSPIRSEQWPAAGAALAPDLGRNSVEILQGLLGMDEVRIRDLIERGVVVDSGPAQTSRATTE